MAKTSFKVTFSAKVSLTGEQTITVDHEPGEPIRDLKKQAEEEAESEVQDELEDSLSDYSIDNVDVTIDEVERVKCRYCRGRGFRIDILDAGEGTIKVGPCPECQRVPTTKDAATAVMEMVEKATQELEDEEDC